MHNGLNIQVSGDSGEGYAWEMAEMTVPSALTPYVMRICGYREYSPAPLRRLEPPYSGLPMIIGFGSPLEVSGARYRLDKVDAFVAGLDLSAAYTEGSGHQGGVQIDLTPLGAAHILGMPLHPLSRSLVRLDDLLGRDGRELRQRLGEANDWESRLRLARDFVCRRLAANAPPPALVAFAIRCLTDSKGHRSIEAMAGEAGVSRKHLTQQFRTWTGLPPSAYGRLLRFERAVDEIKRRPASADWAQIAAGCGYYDQPHFNRDFKAFTGLSPSGFVARLLPDGGVAA